MFSTACPDASHLSLPLVTADLANKYYSDEVEEGMTAAVGAAGAQAAVDAAQGCADEAQTALGKAQGSMQELEGKRSGADDILLAMLKGNMPLMEAGLNAGTQALMAAKAAAAAAKAAAAKGCKQSSRPAAKKAKR
jgi:hypothetical protein